MSDSFATLWTVAHQAPLSMEFCRQEYWSVYDQEPMHNMNYHLFLVMPKMYNIYFNKLRHKKTGQDAPNGVLRDNKKLLVLYKDKG